MFGRKRDDGSSVSVETFVKRTPPQIEEGPYRTPGKPMPDKSYIDKIRTISAANRDKYIIHLAETIKKEIEIAAAEGRRSLVTSRMINDDDLREEMIKYFDKLGFHVQSHGHTFIKLKW